MLVSDTFTAQSLLQPLSDPQLECSSCVYLVHYRWRDVCVSHPSCWMCWCFKGDENPQSTMHCPRVLLFDHSWGTAIHHGHTEVQKQAQSSPEATLPHSHHRRTQHPLLYQAGQIQETGESISTKPWPSPSQLALYALPCVQTLSSWFQEWSKISRGLTSKKSTTRGHCWNKDTAI